MTCKGTCIGYHVTPFAGGSRYANGRKYCSHCMTWMLYDGLRCPCCRYRIRGRPKRRRKETSGVGNGGVT